MPSLVPFKSTPEVELNMHVFSAERTGKHPALVWFFCGGWQGFNAEKFYPQATYFQSRGLTVFMAEVRSTSVHGTTGVHCVRDAKSAIRWVRLHASDYAIDPEQVIVAGGSAAGHVTACADIIDGFEEEGEDLSVSSRPTVMCLFNPALSVDRQVHRVNLFGSQMVADALSPINYVRPGVAPSILFQGDIDTATPAREATYFLWLMEQAGNDCDLKMYEGQGHGFFNWFDGKNPYFSKTLKDMDDFLQRHGLLIGPDTVDDFCYSGAADMTTM